MYTLLKSVGLQVVLAQEAPYFIISFVIASLFYKWRSFALEAIGFLVTWAILSYLGNTLVVWVRARGTQSTPTL
jgi:hypothetical protein